MLVRCEVRPPWLSACQLTMRSGQTRAQESKDIGKRYRFAQRTDGNSGVVCACMQMCIYVSNLYMSLSKTKWVSSNRAAAPNASMYMRNASKLLNQICQPNARQELYTVAGKNHSMLALRFSLSSQTKSKILPSSTGSCLHSPRHSVLLVLLRPNRRLHSLHRLSALVQPA